MNEEKLKLLYYIALVKRIGNGGICFDAFNLLKSKNIMLDMSCKGCPIRNRLDYMNYDDFTCRPHILMREAKRAIKQADPALLLECSLLLI
jgi:hypothetical protein